jgi:membrane protease YdiL (CAAX protease family)
VQARPPLLVAAAILPVYGLWLALSWFNTPTELKAALLLDVVVRLVVPLLILTSLYRFGHISPPRYGLTSPFSSRRKSEVLGLMLITMMLLLTYILVANVVGPAEGIPLSEGIEQRRELPAVWIASIIIYLSASASFSEELFFRGLPRLIFVAPGPIWIKHGGYLVVSSLVFGLMHWPYGMASVVSAVYFGVVAASIMIVTNNLWYPLVGHFITNMLVMSWRYDRIGALPI